MYSNLKKEVIRSGQIGMMRNGDCFSVSYSKDDGYYGLTGNGGIFSINDSYNTDLTSKTNSKQDIVRLCIPTSLVDRQPTRWHLVLANEVENTIVWESDDPIQEEPPQADVSVSMFIAINDKPVDLNNLSTNERQVLESMGILTKPDYANEYYD